MIRAATRLRCSRCGVHLRPFFTSSALLAADPYVVLGVPRTANADEIKAAYRKAALRWHPDRHSGPDKARAEEKFKELSQAYQTLSTSPQRPHAESGAAAGGGSDRSREEWARRSWEQQQQQQQQQSRARAQQQGYQQPPWQEAGGAFSQSEAERIFREAFGGVSGLAELLRRAQAGGVRHRSAMDELFGEVLRQAAAASARGGPFVEVQDEIFLRPDGRRVRRRTRTIRSADGRVQHNVEEQDLNDTSRHKAAQQSEPASGLAQALRTVAAPVVAAAVARVTSFVVAHAADALRGMLRLLVRRIFGR